MFLLNCNVFKSGNNIVVKSYSSFGMPMPGRTFSGSDYRYGFNGKENDNEVKGNGNCIDFGARIYDPRLGRFLSIDPLNKKFPFFSPYSFAGNTPIQAIDKDGEYVYLVINDPKSLKPVIICIDEDNIKLVQGIEMLRQTKTGKPLFDKYMNNTEEDVYINVKELESRNSGGLTLNPHKNPLNENGIFKVKLFTGIDKFQAMLDFSNFQNVEVRKDAKSSTFVVFNSNPINNTEEGKAESAGHELLHVEYFSAGNFNQDSHHDLMGEKPNSSPEKPLPRLREELKKVEEEKKKEDEK